MSNRTKGAGYEYEVVGHCDRTGRPRVAPIAWGHPTRPRPVYSTCLCCGRKNR